MDRTTVAQASSRYPIAQCQPIFCRRFGRSREKYDLRCYCHTHLHYSGTSIYYCLAGRIVPVVPRFGKTLSQSSNREDYGGNANFSARLFRTRPPQRKIERLERFESFSIESIVTKM